MVLIRSKQQNTLSVESADKDSALHLSCYPMREELCIVFKIREAPSVHSADYVGV